MHFQRYYYARDITRLDAIGEPHYKLEDQTVEGTRAGKRKKPKLPPRRKSAPKVVAVEQQEHRPHKHHFFDDREQLADASACSRAGANHRMRAESRPLSRAATARLRSARRGASTTRRRLDERGASGAPRGARSGGRDGAS